MMCCGQLCFSCRACNNRLVPWINCERVRVCACVCAVRVCVGDFVVMCAKSSSRAALVETFAEVVGPCSKFVIHAFCDDVIPFFLLPMMKSFFVAML